MTAVSAVDMQRGRCVSQANRHRIKQSQIRGHLVPTIFHEAWWLAAASGGTCQEAIVEANGKIIGRLPYMAQRKWLQTVLVMPTLTHVLGPALADEVSGDGNARSLRAFTTTTELIRQLPPSSHTWFELHRGVADTLAFEAAGYATGVNFTMDIAPAPAETLWGQMRDKTRNTIRRAQEQLSVERHFTPAQFLDFYEANLVGRGMRNAFHRQHCEAVITACLHNEAGALLAAFDASGTPEAAIFTVWDQSSEYFLMSTRRSNAANGAISLLIWTALKQCAAVGRTFDVDRIDSRRNLTLLTGFGGMLRPRYYVSRTTPTFGMARRVKGWLSQIPQGSVALP